MPELNDLDEGEEELDVVAAIPANATDRIIEKGFETGRLRVVQERNDFFLPHVVDFIEGRRWGNLHPEYQRRLRWDVKKKSKLIESFIMNVPVPPIFLYEKDLGSYEVMDGQQRINTIIDFLQGRFELNGLKIWPALNGRRFADLPPMVRRGLERSKLSAITLMSDGGGVGVNNVDLRAQVFERLNTGGERLNPQELRNSLYSGEFNNLIVKLSSTKYFTDAWEIPNHAEHTRADGSPDDKLKENNYFKRMLDVEIALRFFAFRDHTKISGSVRGMLDSTMKNNKNLSLLEVQNLEKSFIDAIALSSAVFGDEVFRLPTEGRPRGILSRPLYDAEMVAMYRLAARRDDLLAKSQQVRENVSALAKPSAPTYELMVGRANTAATIKQRLETVEQAILKAL